MKHYIKSIIALLVIVLIQTFSVFASEGKVRQNVSLQVISNTILYELGKHIADLKSLKDEQISSLSDLVKQFQNRFNAYPATHFDNKNAQNFYQILYNKLRVFEQELEQKRQDIWSLIIRAEPELYNSLDETYKNNFVGYPLVDPKKIYDLLDLSDKYMTMSAADVRAVIDDKKNIEDKGLKRQLNFIFSGDAAKKNYDSYIAGPEAINTLLQGRSGITPDIAGMLQNGPLQKVIELKNIVSGMLNFLRKQSEKLYNLESTTQSCALYNYVSITPVCAA